MEHLLRNRSSWGQDARIGDFAEACAGDERCEAFDSHGNLFSCRGGCNERCCEMLTALTYDQTGPTRCTDPHSGMYICVDHETDLYTKYATEVWSQRKPVFEPYSHASEANFHTLAQEAQRSAGAAKGPRQPCLNVLVLTVPRGSGGRGETPLLVRSLRSLAKLNATLATRGEKPG